MSWSLPQIVQIARQAGQDILSIYNNPSLFGDIDYKADDSPLTLADQTAHKTIAAALEAMLPEIPILSEEGKHLPYEERKNWTQFWLVDPLDGTKEFIKRNGEFTVNIALIEGNKPVVGVVHVPVTDTTYFGSLNGGAFKQEGNNAPEPIEAPLISMSQKNLRVVASRSHMSEPVQEFIAKLDEPQTVSMGSSLKFMLLAEGKADVYPRLAPTMEWDTGAAQAVLEAAGGTIIHNETGNPLDYNKENLLNPWFIAYAKRHES
jgi:3'(2'), 5'-bisphosphate nucleotidase